MLESEDDKAGMLAEFLQCDREYMTPMRGVIRFPRKLDFAIELTGFAVQRPKTPVALYAMLTVTERIRAVHKLRLSGGPEVSWPDDKTLLCDYVGTTGPYEIWDMGPVSQSRRVR